MSRLLSTVQAAGVDLQDQGFIFGLWDAPHQQDGAEYAMSLLEAAQPAFFLQSWETRVMVGDTSETLVQASGFAPLILRKSVVHTEHLQSLIDAWSAADNAITPFSSDSVGKILQIDRVFHDDQGRPRKTTTKLNIGDVLLLPHFVYDTTYELIPDVTGHCLP